MKDRVFIIADPLKYLEFTRVICIIVLVNSGASPEWLYKDALGI